MELLIWSIIFAVAVAALLMAAKRLFGASLGLFGRKAGAFALLAGVLPELALALAALSAARPELVFPIAVGSSIAQILLVCGICAAAAAGISFRKESIEADLPLFVAGLAIFCFCACDGEIIFAEGALMVFAFFAAGSAMLRGGEGEVSPHDVVSPGFLFSGRRLVCAVATRFGRGFDAGKKNVAKSLGICLAAALILALAADFAITSMVDIGNIVMAPAALLAISILAIGLALPEIASSVKDMRQNCPTPVLGNVFAATLANILLVCGAAALFSPLPVKDLSIGLGMPFLIAAALLLTISAFSRKISTEQSWLYLILYVLFFAKLFGLF